MAQYKVIQDIESEDKLLGPLTLKGFIYAVIAGLCGFVDFRLVLSPELGTWRFGVILLLLFPMALFGVLASPLGRQQPTEVWLLAHLRFLLKPRMRLWDQTGITTLVTVTVPKKIQNPRTKGLSGDEVKSRLETLTATLDSRGWAIKNLNLQPSPDYESELNSDRLVAPNAFNPAAINVDIRAEDDIMDEKNNPTAQYFDGLMQEKASARKMSISSSMSQARKEAATPTNPSAIPNSTQDLAQASTSPSSVTPHQKLDASQSDYRLLRSGFGAGQAAKDKMTDEDRADKLELAQSGNDLSVATIAKLANRKNAIQQISPNEVVISLH